MAHLNSPHSSPFHRRKRFSLRFRIPYYTQWGHSLVILGSEPSLGAWNLCSSVPMMPQHQGQELFWNAVVCVPENFHTEYRYYVVDEKLNVIRRESGSARHLNLPGNLPDGASVEVNDLWQDASSPESLLSRSAFQKAVFQQNAAAGHDTTSTLKDNVTGVPSYTWDSHDSMLVQFHICCPRLRSGQEVYLTGSAAAMGKWVFGKASRLSAKGGPHWLGECVLKTSEFPLKYLSMQFLVT